MLFYELVETHMETSLISDVKELLKIKENSSEMGVASKCEKLNDYIEESIAQLKIEIDKLSTPKKQSWSPLNDIFLQSLDVRGRIKDIRVAYWATYESIHNELPLCDDNPAYESAVKSAVINDAVRINGNQHQNGLNGIPVFSDGTYMLYSMRAWGALMAEVWSEIDGRNYNYMDFYMW